MSQEVMTKADAERLRQYENQYESWRSTHAGARRSVAFSVLGAAILALLSWWASGESGAINRPVWFQFFAIVTFAGFCALGITSIVSSAIFCTNVRPERPRADPKIVDNNQSE